MKTVIKIVLIALFVNFVNKAQAQSKEETVKWLTEKMMKECFLEDDKVNRKVKIISAGFDENFLTIKTEINKAKDDNFGKATYVVHQIKVDLTQLDLDFITKYGGLATNGKHIEMSNGPREKIVMGSYYFFIINPDCEPDIINRFRKAIAHYQSIMTIKKSKEIF